MIRWKLIPGYENYKISNLAGEKKLNCYEFGRRIIDAQDLDPVYVLAANAGFNREEMRGWLLAYWCFYNVGTASWVIERKSGQNGSSSVYWNRMQEAAGSSDYPRGRERRHFRGAASVNSVNWLRSRGLSELFEPFNRYTTLPSVIEYVKTWVEFGPWIAFKVADMIEVLGLSQIDFSEAPRFLFDSPRHGAKRLWNEHNSGLDPSREPGGVEKWAMDLIVENVPVKAPPRFARLVNYQEAETILCKWDAYMNGRYHIGEDIEACRKALLRYSKCKTSQRLFKAGTTGGLW